MAWHSTVGCTIARHSTTWHGAPPHSLAHRSTARPPGANPVPSLPARPQGIFVQLVKANSPASLVGLRFGDQILQIDGKNCTGWSSDKAHRALKKASPEKIVMVVRDR